MTLLGELVQTSQRVGATAARRVKVGELAALIKSLTGGEIDIGVHYLSGETRQGKIGIGYAAVRAAAATPAAELATLSIGEVDDKLSELGAMRGSGSAARRAAALEELFARLTAPEQQFLLRLLIGELRQGALAGVMIDAIAAAADLPATTVRRAAMYSKSLGAVASVALREGTQALAKFQLELFSPVSPMLAQTAADVAEALQEIHGAAAFEWKMDGARIQVHKLGDEVRIYTRSLNEVTAAIPEIAELARTFAQHTLVLDGEAIAFDASGRPHPFQVTHAALRPQAQCRSDAQCIADPSIFLRLPAFWRGEHRDAYHAGALPGPRRSCSRGMAGAATGHGFRSRGARFL